MDPLSTCLPGASPSKRDLPGEERFAWLLTKKDMGKGVLDSLLLRYFELSKVRMGNARPLTSFTSLSPSKGRVYIFKMKSIQGW